MWASMTVAASIVPDLDAAWLVVWFRAYKGKWQMGRVYAFNATGDFLGDVPKWSLPWNIQWEWETKALIDFGKPHP